VENEVDEYANVHDEDEEQDNDPGSGNTGLAAGGVLLGFEGGVEVLCLELVELGAGVILIPWSVYELCHETLSVGESAGWGIARS
jgi:hypothetical protein